jgi:hypothetical protein
MIRENAASAKSTHEKMGKPQSVRFFPFPFISTFSLLFIIFTPYQFFVKREHIVGQGRADGYASAVLGMQKAHSCGVKGVTVDQLASLAVEEISDKRTADI